MKNVKSNVFFFISLLCAVWFVLTSWFWVYGINVIISFPFGLVSFTLWLQRKKYSQWTMGYKIIGIILIAGVVSAVGTLIGLLLYG